MLLYTSEITQIKDSKSFRKKKKDVPYRGPWTISLVPPENALILIFASSTPIAKLGESYAISYARLLEYCFNEQATQTLTFSFSDMKTLAPTVSDMPIFKMVNSAKRVIANSYVTLHAFDISQTNFMNYELRPTRTFKLVNNSETITDVNGVPLPNLDISTINCAYQLPDSIEILWSKSVIANNLFETTVTCSESFYGSTYSLFIIGKVSSPQPVPSPIAPKPSPIPQPKPSPSPVIPYVSPIPSPPIPKPSPKPSPIPPMPSPVVSPIPSPTPVKSPTPKPSPKPSPIPSPAYSPSPSPKPSPIPSPVHSTVPPKPSPVPHPSLSPIPQPKPSPIPVKSPTPISSPKPSPKPSPTPAQSILPPKPSPVPVVSPKPSPVSPLPTPTPIQSPIKPKPSPIPVVSSPTNPVNPTQPATTLQSLTSNSTHSSTISVGERKIFTLEMKKNEKLTLIFSSFSKTTEKLNLFVGVGFIPSQSSYSHHFLSNDLSEFESKQDGPVYLLVEGPKGGVSVPFTILPKISVIQPIIPTLPTIDQSTMHIIVIVVLSLALVGTIFGGLACCVYQRKKKMKMDQYDRYEKELMSNNCYQ